MKHFRNIDGWQWIGCYVNGQLYLVTRLGRTGDCVRP